MILALKDRDSIWVAVSTKSTYTGVNMEDVILEENLKMWRPAGHENAILAVEGASMTAEVLRYADLAAPNEPLTHATLIQDLLPSIKERLHERNALNGERMWDQMLIAKKDKAFVVTCNFSLLEVENVAAVGSARSEDLAYGAARLRCDLPPVERITEIFRTLERAEKYRHFPLVIMNTMSDERIVIDK